ncbi:MAG TPA: SAF domain-containing protein, partial [Hyphomicrobium sp.]|nr:SAF domain-containing protein [Hyphomicrobium sp.]
MKRAQLIGFSVALVAAGLAYYVAGALLQPPAPITVEKHVDSTQVLVAGTNIPVGDIVSEGSFRWMTWPAEAVSHDYVTRTSASADVMHKLAGSVARAPILAGEPITDQKL